MPNSSNPTAGPYLIAFAPHSDGQNRRIDTVSGKAIAEVYDLPNGEGLGNARLFAASFGAIKALEMFETCFAEPIENDEEMGGADTVESVCSLWHRFIKPALAEARGEVRTYCRPAEQEG